MVIALALISVFVLYPRLSVMIASGLGMPGYKGPFNGQPLRQGLDLKGGMEIILGPDFRADVATLDEISNTVKQQIEKVTSVTTQPKAAKLGLQDMGKYEGLKFTFASAGDTQRVIAAGVIEQDLSLGEGAGKTTYKLLPSQVGRTIEITVNQVLSKDFIEKSMTQADEIIKLRVNRLGLTEPDIRLDLPNQRIMVQLPSVKTEKEAQEILQRTGRLNFRLNGVKVLFGDDLKSAKAGYDGGKVVINFSFGKEGATRLRYITENNLKKPMAIYLDEDPLMDNPAPIIESAIPDGNGQITLGGAGIEEAKKDAILMEAGSLPISLRNLSFNQVAPTLGKDMIRQSLVAGVAGIALVVIFMLGFYGLMGALADVALILYVALVLVVMSLMRGVLTLPGVAGLILSVGMAVDANIIIFERIKDELRTGKRVRPAVAGGFSRAFWTIFDSNLTTLIIAGVLLIYGYGAVRGFAITLGIGIMVSMFTALIVTRFLMDLLIDRDPDKFVSRFRA